MHNLKTPSIHPEFNRLTGRGKFIYSRHHIIIITVIIIIIVIIIKLLESSS